MVTPAGLDQFFEAEPTDCAGCRRHVPLQVLKLWIIRNARRSIVTPNYDDNQHPDNENLRIGNYTTES